MYIFQRHQLVLAIKPPVSIPCAGASSHRTGSRSLCDTKYRENPKFGAGFGDQRPSNGSTPSPAIELKDTKETDSNEGVHSKTWAPSVRRRIQLRRKNTGLTSDKKSGSGNPKNFKKKQETLHLRFGNGELVDPSAIEPESSSQTSLIKKAVCVRVERGRFKNEWRLTCCLA